MKVAPIHFRFSHFRVSAGVIPGRETDAGMGKSRREIPQRMWPDLILFSWNWRWIGMSISGLVGGFDFFNFRFPSEVKLGISRLGFSLGWISDGLNPTSGFYFRYVQLPVSVGSGIANFMAGIFLGEFRVV